MGPGTQKYTRKRIHHKIEERIDNSVPWVTVMPSISRRRLVMTNSDLRDRIVYHIHKLMIYFYTPYRRYIFLSERLFNRLQCGRMVLFSIKTVCNLSFLFTLLHLFSVFFPVLFLLLFLFLHRYQRHNIQKYFQSLDTEKN